MPTKSKTMEEIATETLEAEKLVKKALPKAKLAKRPTREEPVGDVVGGKKSDGETVEEKQARLEAEGHNRRERGCDEREARVRDIVAKLRTMPEREVEDILLIRQDGRKVTEYLRAAKGIIRRGE